MQKELILEHLCFSIAATMSDKCCLLVCGGGNGAHVLAGLGAADPNTEVRVLTLFRDEAERWTKSMETNDFTVHFKIHGKELSALKNKPDVVSQNLLKLILLLLNNLIVSHNKNFPMGKFLQDF